MSVLFNKSTQNLSIFFKWKMIWVIDLSLNLFLLWAVPFLCVFSVFCEVNVWKFDENEGKWWNCEKAAKTFLLKVCKNTKNVAFQDVHILTPVCTAICESRSPKSYGDGPQKDQTSTPLFRVYFHQFIPLTTKSSTKKSQQCTKWHQPIINSLTS
jgi:hypothetical protein